MAGAGVGTVTDSPQWLSEAVTLQCALLNRNERGVGVPRAGTYTFSSPLPWPRKTKFGKLAASILVGVPATIGPRPFSTRRSAAN